MCHRTENEVVVLGLVVASVSEVVEARVDHVP
jgi:hypothetical protein